jgi:hypothetical protein
LATEAVRDVTLTEAVYLHIHLMRLLGKRLYGVFDRALIESTLTRPPATAITDEYLLKNGYEMTTTAADTVEMVLAVEGDRWGVDEVESWLRERAKLIHLKVRSND